MNSYTNFEHNEGVKIIMIHDDFECDEGFPCD
jgi:hypothetical protein